MQLGIFQSDSADAVACLNKANASKQVQAIDKQIGDLSANWRPTGFYTPSDVQRVLDAFAAEAEAAGAVLAAAPRSTRDAETMIAVAFEDLLANYKDPAKHLQQAVLDAKRTGAQIIDAPNFKRWVIRSLRAISHAYVTAMVLQCRYSWVESILDKGYRAIAKLGSIIWPVVGVAADIVVAAGGAVIKAAGGAADAIRIAGTILTWALRLLPIAAVGAGGFLVYKQLKKRGVLNGHRPRRRRLVA